MKNLIIIFLIFPIYLYGFSYERDEATALDLAILSHPQLNMPVSSALNKSYFNGRLFFNMQYLPNLSIGGAGRNLGSEVIIFDNSSSIDEQDLPDDILFQSRRDYGNTINPIITDPSPETPFSMNLGYNYDNTRIEITWFHMSATDKQSGKVQGYYFDENDNRQNVGFGFVNFWNMGLDLHASRGFPPSWFNGFRDLDENEDGQYEGDFDPEKGATEWNVLQENKLNSFRLTVQHPVMGGEKINISLLGGLQYGRWKDNLVQSLGIVAHRTLIDKWTQNIWDENAQDSVHVIVYQDYVFNNIITLETNSSARINSFGVLAGLSAEWNVLPSLFLRFKGSLTTLNGSSSLFGTGIDVDNIRFRYNFRVYDEPDNMIYSDLLRATEYLSGVFELPEYSRSIISFNYLLDIEARFVITGNISLVAGYSYSLWNNLPVSPQWTYSDQFTEPYNASAIEKSWDTNINSALSTSGFKFGVGLTF